MLDPIKNLVYVKALIGYNSSATSITLESGEGSKLPDPSTDGAFNLVWYDHTLYKNPADDPNVEIIRVTAKTGDVLSTIVRAQESTIASNKNTTGSSYRLILGLTKKTITDIDNLKENKIVTSKTVYIDGNRADSYTEDGTINRPYKTIHEAVAALSGTTTATAIHIAPATYTESADVTLPNCPIVIWGNGATISNAGHTITFQNPNSARYNLFTTANVVYNNFSAGARNMVYGGSITGNVTVNAYVEVIQCQLNGGLVTVGSAGQLVLSICSPTSRFTSAGVLMFNGVNINTGYAGYLVTSTAGIFTSANSIVVNTNTGTSAGAVSCDNGAPITAPNMIVNSSFITSGGGATDWGLYAGTAYTMYGKNNVVANPTTYSIYGTHLIPVSSDIIGGATVMGLGSDATGDMYYRAATTGLLTRLGIGSTGKVLSVSGGLPFWSGNPTVNNAITATSNAASADITYKINTITNNSAATLTITIPTSGAVDGQIVEVRVYDFSAVTQTVAWVNTENGEGTAKTTSNGSTTLPLANLFQYNSQTSKWRCIA